MTETKQLQLTAVQERLDLLLDDKIKAIPKGFNKTRFLQNCLTILTDVKDIDKMEPHSIARTMLKGAFMGLDFFNKECYAVPYNNKETGKKELNFQTDYKGEIKLCKLYSTSPIRDIYAKVVREGDQFSAIIEDGDQCITFIPKEFSDEPIIGAFAIVLFKDGSKSCETMSTQQIEHIKNVFSRKDFNGNFSKAWRETPEEMYKKTILRRLCKGVDLTFDRAEQDKIFREADGSGPDKIIDGEVEVVPDVFADDPKQLAEAVDVEERGDPSQMTEEELKEYEA